MSKTQQTIHVKISVGELLDKITILEIKAARIGDPQKLANVRHELNELNGVAKTIPIDADGIGHIDQLREVNSLLWDVEDDIRECEARADFGARFIELARSVYRHNDRRALLKKRLNELTGSELVEEKSYKGA